MRDSMNLENVREFEIRLGRSNELHPVLPFYDRRWRCMESWLLGSTELPGSLAEICRGPGES